MNQSEMMQKVRDGNGFIAALDQSGGSTPKALKNYGVEEGAWSNDEEMFGLVHQMRERIITSPSFGSARSSAPSCSSGRWTASSAASRRRKR